MLVQEKCTKNTFKIMLYNILLKTHFLPSKFANIRTFLYRRFKCTFYTYFPEPSQKAKTIDFIYILMGYFYVGVRGHRLILSKMLVKNLIFRQNNIKIFFLFFYRQLFGNLIYYI